MKEEECGGSLEQLGCLFQTRKDGIPDKTNFDSAYRGILSRWDWIYYGLVTAK